MKIPEILKTRKKKLENEISISKNEIEREKERLNRYENELQEIIELERILSNIKIRK